ncbi:PREDICTED: glutathione S-transferase 1-1-like [Rhagoletis zephyria]|uniref:glutathione S-transferase 1-1-like n=1 Tax=Rhagoletis zephyria TaxID=28612 RepID=UPI00081189E4|nr:PREDICTED: glutathione S-transferase 1-1-like [Rhagoletis zephyria]XP_017474961.1 PREDICTED: glutathione S-transferase 1-1-like [Rhagoletis zephyria]
MDFYYLLVSAPCRSILMLAKALGIELNRKELFLAKGEHLTPEFLKINPQHTIPTLVDNGFSIWESRVILIYLAEKYGKDDSLYPKCPQKRALVNQRLFFDLNLYSCFAEYYYPIARDKQPPVPESLTKLQGQLEFLNTFLEGQTYVANNSMSIADFTLLASVASFEATGIDLSKYPNIIRWYQHCNKTLPGADENKEGSALFSKYWD